MKQSTKLLSLVLALLMAFSCMSVIGSAALVKNEVAYDCIDDADLSYEQVADIALDLVDQLLADADIGEVFDVLGLSINLSTINTTFDSLYSTSQHFLFKIAKGFLGDIGDLDFSPLKDPNTGDGYQRENGDYRIIAALLDFVGCDKNAGILSKAAYGIGTKNGISLGSILGGLLDLGSVQDILANIPGFLVGLVFDLLVYGSYDYDMDIEDIKAAGSTLTETYPDMDTFDEILPNAIYNLLTKPQDYEWKDTNGDGEDEKIWDMSSVLMPGLKLTAADINPLSNSLFGLLDKVAQIAIDEIGIPALNNNLKKALMLAVEADLDEIDYATLPADVKAVFDKTEEYVTYFAYDKIMKSGGVWYYTTLESEVEKDPTTGEPKLDEEGNEITFKDRKYFKVNMAAANEFASLINWDWDFVTSDVTPGANQTALLYDDIKAIDGSLAGGINHLIGMVYDVALAPAAKADFVASIQEYIDEEFTGWITDAEDFQDNMNFNTNLEYLLKYILTEFGDKVFGQDSEYANYTMEDVAGMTIIEIAAMIGPGFFEDAMPQIILPKNADGTYAFHEGVQLWEFAACVLRELMTGIAPIVNYDKYIFANGDVTSANDRLFVDYEAKLGDLNAAADAWFNIILNMGTDLGVVYLQQLTNFPDFLDERYGNGTYKGFNLDAWINSGDTTDGHWKTNLNEAILWALDYIGGERSTGVLDGITYDYLLNNVSDPIDKLSYILNKILPLGFISNGAYTSDAYDLDLNLVIDGIKTLLTDFDLSVVFALFGRNTTSKYNMLDDASVGTAVLDLVNDILALVFRKTILQNVNATTSVSTQSIDNVVTQASLKTTVYNILTGLNGSKDYILKNIAPVLGKLIKEWGGEQEFSKPTSDLSSWVVVQTNGSTYVEGSEKLGSIFNRYDSPTLTPSPISFNFKNNSEGVWRHYRDAAGAEYKDEQYQIQIVSVAAENQDGSTSTYVSQPTIVTTGKIGFGQSGQITFNVGSTTHTIGSHSKSAGDRTAVPESGALARIKIGYKIFLEDGTTALLDGKVFYDQQYIWLSRYGTDDHTGYHAETKAYRTTLYTPIYVPYYENSPQSTIDFVKNTTVAQTWREWVAAGDDETHTITVKSATNAYGFTPSNVSVSIPNKNMTSTDLRLFDNYTAEFFDEDGKVAATTQISGVVPSAENFSIPSLTYDKDGNVNGGLDSPMGATSTWSVYFASKKDNKTMDLVLKYYNADYRDRLVGLVADESSAMRVASDYKHYYNANATVVLTSALVNEDEIDENGNFILRETNFGVNADGVTVINCAQAWNNYSTALNNALKLGLSELNAQTVYNFKDIYNALRVAVNDLDRCYATEEDGAQTLGTTVDALEGSLRASQARTTDIYNYTDYKMFRINKYNAARDDVNWYINLRKDAQPSIDDIDTYFGYNWMEENDFEALVGAHTVKYGEKAGTSVAKNGYYDYLVALLENFEEEELNEKKAWLDARKVEFARVQEADLAMAENLLNITEARLLKRDSNATGAITKQLADEIASAQNMIGTANKGRYTAGSWENYIEAYNDAVDAQNSGSQKQVFDAKYQLLVQRKNLVKVEDAADYAELNALIGYAKFALAHADLYNNANKEFGQVLAELGMDPIVSVDGYEVQLFPGSALLTVDRAYGDKDQDKIDDAATALKEALARLEFKGLNVKDLVASEATGKDVFVEAEDLVIADEDEGIEGVSALVSHIAKDQGEEAVKNYFSVVAENAQVTVDDVIVTNDHNYSVSYEGADEFTGLAGTNSTVTFYTTYKTAEGDIKLPVATVKIVVDGDLNGDGTVDVLDAAYGALVASEKGELEGCYLLAGDLKNNDRVVGDADYQQIANLVVA